MRDLIEMLAEPRRAVDLTAEEVTAALAELAALESLLKARLTRGDCSAQTLPITPTAPEVGARPSATSGPDDLLTVEEVAAMLKVTPRWLYRHARGLPFTRKLSPKVLRFSRSGALRWLASQRP